MADKIEKACDLCKDENKQHYQIKHSFSGLVAYKIEKNDQMDINNPIYFKNDLHVVPKDYEFLEDIVECYDCLHIRKWKKYDKENENHLRMLKYDFEYAERIKKLYQNVILTD